MLRLTKFRNLAAIACLAISATAGAQVGSVAPTTAINTGQYQGAQDPLRVLLQSNPGAYINCNGPTGNCSFSEPTRSNLAIISWLKENQFNTLDQYKDLVSRTVSDMNDLVRSLYANQGPGQPQGIVSLANAQHSSGNPVNITDLYQSFADFQQRQALVTQDFALVSAFLHGNGEGMKIEEKGFLTTNIPNWAPMQFQALDTGFWNGIKVANKIVCAQTFDIRFLDGEGAPASNVSPFVCDEASATVQIKIENPGVVLSDQTQREYRQAISDKKKPPQEAKDASQKMFDQVRTLVMHFVDVWGTDMKNAYTNQSIVNKWLGGLDPRVQQTLDGRKAERDAAFQAISDIFWLRSAMRLAYGLPLGAFQINFIKDNSPFRAKAQFMTQYETLQTIPADPLFSQDPIDDGIQTLRRNYFEALNVSESKSTDILNGNFGLLDKVNSATSVWNRTENQWKALNMVIKLLAADFYEEAALWNPAGGGLEQVHKLYLARYVDVEKETHDYYHNLANKFADVLGINADNPSQDAYSDNNFATGTSIKGTASEMAVALQLWLSNISQVRMYQIALNVGQKYASTVEGKRSNQRLKDITK